MQTESEKIKERYAKRNVAHIKNRYSLLNPSTLKATQEKQKCILDLFKNNLQWQDFSEKKLFEIGCGNGGNLLDFLRFGFLPKNLIGNELLEERCSFLRETLPTSLIIYEGDILDVEVDKCSQDIVFQSLVFSSILEDSLQESAAHKMWEWVKPGGGILWYDFTYNNPSNPDVRGVPISRVKDLFPNGKATIKRLTLAPPISRRVCSIWPPLYHILNTMPWLRTHILVWIEKPKN